MERVNQIIVFLAIFSLHALAINVSALKHQISITNVTVPERVCINEQAILNVQVENSGDYTENVTVRIHSDFGIFSSSISHRLIPNETSTIPVSIRPTEVGTSVLEIEAYTEIPIREADPRDTETKVIEVKDCEICDINIKSFEHKPSLPRKGDTLKLITFVENLGKRCSLDITLEVNDELKDFKKITLDKDEADSVIFTLEAERGEMGILIELEAECGDTEEVETKIDVDKSCLPLNVLVKDNEGKLVENSKVIVVGGDYKTYRYTNSEGVAGFCVPKGKYTVTAEYQSSSTSVDRKIYKPTLVKVTLPEAVTKEVCGIDLNVSYPTLARAGESRTVTATLKNTGSLADKFDITCSGDSAYWVSPSLYETSLDPNETEEFYFSYQIPSNAAPGTYHLQFSVEPEICGLRDSESTTTKIMGKEEEVTFAAPRVRLEITNPDINLTIGKETSWPVRLVNSGDEVEIVKVNLLGLPRSWVEFSDEIHLKANEERDFYFKLLPPKDANPGTYQGEIKVSYNDYSISKPVNFYVRSKPKKPFCLLCLPAFKLPITPLFCLVVLLFAAGSVYWLLGRFPKPLEKVRPGVRAPIRGSRTLKKRAFRHTNKKGETYWLHKRNGGYYFSKEREGAIPKPPGYTVVETRSGLPMLKRS